MCWACVWMGGWGAGEGIAGSMEIPGMLPGIGAW
jgi:hypothetical protein